MENNQKNINFLQSEEWRKFQESVGRKTFSVENERFSASIIEHELPIVGKYFYCPRGPIFSAEAERISNFKFQISNGIQEIIKIAKENNAGWARFDPRDENVLDLIKENINYKIVKAPHDMQPKEIFVINIIKNEDELLSQMSQKTRYNIKLAKNRGVKVFAITNNQDIRYKQISNTNYKKNTKYVEDFLRLTKEMAKRNGIAAHSEEYYRKMIEVLSDDMLKIYVAEYDGKIIAANLILFYGDIVTYLHGASGNEYRNVMAPYLLQWQAILDAKKAGFKFYDLGGVKTSGGWEGITKFKMGFSLNTKPVVFPGSYDIIVNPRLYLLYKFLQKTKDLIHKISK